MLFNSNSRPVSFSSGVPSNLTLRRRPLLASYSSYKKRKTITMSNSRVHHFKLVLLGDTAVGKSCLVVRFVRDEFFEFQEPTIGGKMMVVVVVPVLLT
jgi:hypothetical protein